MSIINYLKSTLVEGVLNDDEMMPSDGSEEPTDTPDTNKSFEGDPKALVDNLIKNAPGMKEQIGTILKYAANSIPNYDIWDAALDYYESLGDEEPVADDSEEVPMDEPEEPVADDSEEPSEEPSDESPKPSKKVPVTDDNLEM